MTTSIMYLIYGMAGFALLFTAACTIAVCITRFSKKTTVSSHPHVTLVKPVKNIDEGFDDNIRSFYTLDYPSYDIVFGIDERTDPCVERLQAIASEFSAIKTSIVATGAEKVGNPKIDTLHHCAESVTGDYVWITDSNVRVAPDTLTRMVHGAQTTGAKIIFSPILGAGNKSFGSIVENSYINLFVSGATIIAWALFKKPVITGKSMLIDMHTLISHYGGFDYFRSFLAEDYVLGDTFKNDGFHVVTNYAWITNINEKTQLKNVYARLSRWALLRRNLNVLYGFEIFTNPLFFIALLLADTHHGSTLAIAGLAFLLLCEYLVLFIVNSHDRKSLRVILTYPAAVMAKYLLQLIVFIGSFLTATVIWRGRRLHIGNRTVISERT